MITDAIYVCLLLCTYVMRYLGVKFLRFPSLLKFSLICVIDIKESCFID